MFSGSILRQHYKIIKLLGRGGFGDTYLAEDLDLPDRPPRVVKHLKPKNPSPNVLSIARRLFDSEARILYQLGSACDQIPTLFAHFEEGDQFYLVQEFIDGHDLTQEIQLGKPLSEPQTIQLLLDVLQILVVVHHHRVIHRDIKPDNIMRQHSDGRLMLIDFGAVKEVSGLTVNSQGQSCVTIMIGTPGYVPSEQAAGHPQLSSDIYAVGMLGIQALTGMHPELLPKDPHTLEVIWRDRVQVSTGLAAILDRMVRYHFSQRYPTAEEALQALNQLIASPPPLPPPLPPTPPPLTSLSSLPPRESRWSRRRVLQTAGLVVLGGSAVVAIDRLRSSDRSQPRSPSGLPLQTFAFETVRVNTQGIIVERRPSQAQSYVEDLGNGIMLEMMRIPGGEFVMGSPETEPNRVTSESPQHPVTLPDFFMGRLPITQAQYEAIMGTNPSNFKGANRPVEWLTWHDAVAFCQKLSEQTGTVYRLPSEAEWEYACRAGTTTPFSLGETITTDLANYRGTDETIEGVVYSGSYGNGPKGLFREETVEAGIFPPNPFGLYDMHGNVYEWCQDVWHDSYKGAPVDGSAWVAGGDSALRILRGGSWYLYPSDCRSASRNKYAPEERGTGVGFRVVCAAV